MAAVLQASLDPIRNAFDEHFITQFDNQVVPLPAAFFLFDRENLRCIWWELIMCNVLWGIHSLGYRAV